MKRSVLICVGTVALVLTAGAQLPNTHRKPPQRAPANPGYRGTSAVGHVAPQRAFSAAHYRQPTLSTARFRQPTSSATRLQPRTNTSFVNRRTMTNTANWGRTRVAGSDWNRFNARPRPSSAFVNRSRVDDFAVRRPTDLASANDRRDLRFRERPHPSSSVLNRFTMHDIAARRPASREFNNKWTDANVRGDVRGSFANSSQTTSFWRGRQAAATNSWRSGAFSGRQYWAFRNYQRQWHDRGWWHDHCGDRIVFVTVYSQPFPFYFDAGYWYPAWGYYPDAYYPYDGPIYGYNDLPPDEVVTNVQTQLYYEGYYDGPIDGILGPDTRAAIANYQADQGLAVTAAIDEPTVESLGLT
jgi:Putative peptidoglycan binding domain